MLDFPAAPTYGQIYNGSNGVSYQWMAPGQWTSLSVPPQLAVGADISVLTFGAVGDWNDTTQTGTDNGPAINAALQYAKSIGGADVMMPVFPQATQANGTGYYTTQTITVPERCRLIGAGLQSTISHAVRIVGALALSPIVDCNGASIGNRATGLMNLAVTRVTGTVPDTSDGVRVTGSRYALIERVLSMRSAFGFHVNNAAVGTLLRECTTTVIHKAHVLWTSGPMLTLDNCSFGLSGVDIACDAYIRIDETVGGPHGPGTDCDTLNCLRTQFNLSDPVDVGNAGCLLDLINYRDPNGTIHFSNCHVEGLAPTSFVIKADAGSTSIKGLTFSQTTIFKDTPGNFFSFDAAAVLRGFTFGNGCSTSFAMNLPTSASSIYQLIGCSLQGGLSCAGASQLTMAGVNVLGDVTFSGAYATFAMTGCAYVSTVFADTSTGNKYWAGNASSNGTPTIPEYFRGVVKFPEFGDSGGAVITHTGTTAKTALKTVVIPNKVLGANGFIEIITFWDNITNNANNKTIHVQFGGAEYTTVVLTTAISYKQHTAVFNQNNPSVQKGQAAATAGGGWGAGSAVAVSGASPTDTSPSNAIISATLAVGTDAITLAGYAIKAHYRP